MVFFQREIDVPTGWELKLRKIEEISEDLAANLTTPKVPFDFRKLFSARVRVKNMILVRNNKK